MRDMCLLLGGHVIIVRRWNESGMSSYRTHPQSKNKMFV